MTFRLHSNDLQKMHISILLDSHARSPKVSCQLSSLSRHSAVEVSKIVFSGSCTTNASWVFCLLGPNVLAQSGAFFTEISLNSLNNI